MPSQKTIGDVLGTNKPPTKQQLEEQERNLNIAAEKNGSLLEEIDRLRDERDELVDPAEFEILYYELNDLVEDFVKFYDDLVFFLEDTCENSPDDIRSFLAGCPLPLEVDCRVRRR